MESEETNSPWGTIITIIVLVVLGFWIFGGDKSSSSSSGGNYYDSENVIDQYDAKSDYWDDIAEYLDGTYTIEACSDNSGNCYDLDADISSGDIDTIYFSNGGYLDIYGADVDSDGSASGDSDEDYWTFQVDDSDIDQAVEDWADYEGYTLE